MQELPNQYVGYTIGKMAYSEIKQEEYTAVLGVVTICQASVEAGLEPYDAYDIADLYLQKISVATSISQYLAYLSEAIQEVVAEINRSKGKNAHSIHIEKCKRYIGSHLNRRFTQNDIAKELNLSPNYFSALFSHHEHMTIKEYALRERIKAAQNLLKFSNEPLASSPIICAFALKVPSAKCSGNIPE